MTKKLLILTAIVMAALFTYAQSLSLSHDGTTLEPNEEITMQGPASNTEMVIEFDVTNNGSSGMSVLVKKVENYLVDSTENTFCWAGLCYPPFVYVSPNAVTIAAGVTHENDFSGHYNPKSHPGESSISYVFFDENNEDDSVMVTVIYTALETGIDDKFNTNYSFSQPYPNPATGFVKFDYNMQNKQSASVKIYSLIGLLVGEMEITSATGTLTFNTDKLEEGFYFYTLFSGNEKMESGKFILKH
ncbi:MAG: T9SS type A sorting domain-containing protein [Bacteroidales bacterium]|nr:T9SS type A sorting domain-containing protein [Bacteroidales bacterium]